MPNSALTDYLAGDFGDMLRRYRESDPLRTPLTMPPPMRLAAVAPDIPDGYGGVYGAKKIVPLRPNGVRPLRGAARDAFRKAVEGALSANIPVGSRNASRWIERRPGRDAVGFGAVEVPSPQEARLPGFRDIVFSGKPTETPNLGNSRFLGDRSGWLLPVLRQEEPLVNGRWRFLESVRSGEADGSAIPRIDFLLDDEFEELEVSEGWSVTVASTRTESLDQRWLVREYLYDLTELIDYDCHTDTSHVRATIAYLFDWLLWSLGHFPEFPDEDRYRPEGLQPKPGLWDGSAHNRLLMNFGFAPFLAFPAPTYFHHFADLAEGDAEDPGYPVLAPGEVVDAVEASRPPGTFAPFADPESAHSFDVAAATASNHTLNVAVASQYPLHLKASLINAYLYWPWAIFPPKAMEFDPAAATAWTDNLPRDIGTRFNAPRYVPQRGAMAMAPMGLYEPGSPVPSLREIAEMPEFVPAATGLDEMPEFIPTATGLDEMSEFVGVSEVPKFVAAPPELEEISEAPEFVGASEMPELAPPEFDEKQGMPDFTEVSRPGSRSELPQPGRTSLGLPPASDAPPVSFQQRQREAEPQEVRRDEAN